jgi:hypothetical protein
LICARSENTVAEMCRAAHAHVLRTVASHTSAVVGAALNAADLKLWTPADWRYEIRSSSLSWATTEVTEFGATLRPLVEETRVPMSAPGLSEVARRELAYSVYRCQALVWEP